MENCVTQRSSRGDTRQRDILQFDSILTLVEGLPGELIDIHGANQQCLPEIQEGTLNIRNNNAKLGHNT